MKARKLAALLNTRYIVHDGGETINIGSPLCSELVTRACGQEVVTWRK